MENYKKGDICTCEISPADNGWIVRYCVTKETEGGGRYEPVMHQSKEKVFLEKETDEAFEFFKKLMLLKKKENY